MSPRNASTALAGVGSGQVLRHHYAPRGSAIRLFKCRDKEVLYAGPAGTGKSRACLEKLLGIALANPGMRGLICRKTLASLGSTALDTWRKHVATEALRVGDCTYYGGSSEEPPQYRFTNGSVIVIGGLDRPTRIMSAEYDVIYVQEATEVTLDDWESLVTRLRNRGTKRGLRQLIADANPAHPTHWLKLRGDAGQLTMITSRHVDNPVYYTEVIRPDGTIEHQLTEEGRDYVETTLGGLTGVRRLRMVDGIWAAAEGVILAGWDERIHLVDRFDIPDDWTRWWVIDFGYTAPYVCQWWAEDPDGRLYRYREIYLTETLVEDHARRMLELVIWQSGYREGQWREPKPTAIICDHDAEDRATLTKHLGMATVAADKRVKVGLQAVQGRMRPAGDGKPRIVYLRDSLDRRDPSLAARKLPTCTEEEIPGYIWDPNKPDTPVKENDHGCDTTRYIVAERDLSARPRARWM